MSAGQPTPRLAGAARATAADRIRELAAAGVTDARIAEKLGLKYGQVRAVRAEFGIGNGRPRPTIETHPPAVGQVWVRRWRYRPERRVHVTDVDRDVVSLAPCGPGSHSTTVDVELRRRYQLVANPGPCACPAVEGTPDA